MARAPERAGVLVEAGVTGFRGLVLEHPALFRLGVQQTETTPGQLVEIREAGARAWTVLQARVARVQQQGGLGTHRVDGAATLFHALCEGLAALEIRRGFPPEVAERVWREAITALVDGFGVARGPAARASSN